MRISFGGGGTDLESYYRKYGGVVVSTTIDKYFYCLVSDSSPDQLQLISADYRSVMNLQGSGEPDWKGELALPRAVIHEYGLRPGHTVFLASEVPPGTGLGSSSAVTVAMIRALSELTGRSLTKHEAAEMACRIEIEKLGMPIGKQDQYAAAFGGFNIFEFSGEGVHVRPLVMRPRHNQRLVENTMLFFTGSTHDAASILMQQKAASEANDEVVVGSLHAIKSLAYEIIRCLESGNFRRYADLLDESWQRKKSLASEISNSFIDECYEAGLKVGARGGKILGAGGGGFLMLYAEQSAQPAVRQAMRKRGLVPMEFDFSTGGAEVLVNSRSFVPDMVTKLTGTGYALRSA
ncbi:MAG: GHMP family kinase ATP-binding protein [Candidatus Dormibacteria bacterium]